MMNGLTQGELRVLAGIRGDVEAFLRTHRRVFLTRAKLKLDKTTAVLRHGEETLHATILSPAGARFEAIPASAPKPQAQQPDVQNLTVRLSGKAKQVRIVVLLTPGNESGTAAIAPLSEWIAQGKLPAQP